MGKPITLEGDKTTGHSTYQPRTPAEWSTNVKINGKGVVLMDGLWNPHGAAPAYRGDPHPSEATHRTTSCSGTVKINGKGVARIGDSVEADTIGAGSADVFAGD